MCQIPRFIYSHCKSEWVLGYLGILYADISSPFIILNSNEDHLPCSQVRNLIHPQNKFCLFLKWERNTTKQNLLMAPRLRHWLLFPLKGISNSEFLSFVIWADFGAKVGSWFQERLQRAFPRCVRQGQWQANPDTLPFEEHKPWPPQSTKHEEHLPRFCHITMTTLLWKMHVSRQKVLISALSTTA